MSDNITFEAERRKVSELGHELLEQELTTGTGGNVSVRRGDRVAVSPSGVPYDEITSDQVPIVDLDGERVSGALAPSNETPLHTLVYRSRDDVGGIVHTHSPYASTFASLGEPIPASHYLIAFAGHKVPVAGYEPPGTEALGELAADTLGSDHDACLLQNHGVIAVGEDGDDAFETALMVEFVARIHYQARSIGEPELLSEANLDHLIEMFRSYGQNS